MPPKKPITTVPENILNSLLDMNDEDFARLELARKAKREGPIKTQLAVALDAAYTAEILPNWIKVDEIRADNGVVNFYRSLGVKKP
jgi:hypothetical protein